MDAKVSQIFKLLDTENCEESNNIHFFKQQMNIVHAATNSSAGFS